MLKKTGKIMILICLCFYLKGINPYLKSEENIINDSILEHIKKAYVAFMYYPTDEMAKKFYLTIPQKIDDAEIRKKILSILFPFGGGNYFEHEILSGNKYVARSALKLLNGSDDLLCNEIFLIMSHLIRLNPRFYLEMLNDPLIKVEDKMTEKIAVFLHDDYFMNHFPLCNVRPLNKLCMYELEMRRSALEKIEGFEKTKAMCLAAINKRLGNIKAIEEGDMEKDWVANQKQVTNMAIELYLYLESKKEPGENQPSLLPENYQYLTEFKKQMLKSELEAFLEHEVAEGNKYVVEAAIKGIYPLVGGILYALLEESIRQNPEFYLDILYNYKREILDDIQEYPLSFHFGWFEDTSDWRGHLQIANKRFIDNKMESLPKIIELEKRQQAIIGVKNEKYEEIKNDCLNQLGRHIREEKRILFNRGNEENNFPLRKKIIQQNELQDWGKVKDAFDEFVKNPTDDKAENFLESIPREATPESISSRDEALKKIFYFYNFQALKYQVFSGNLPAARAIIRLLKHTDGSKLLGLQEVLASLIRINPRLYLEALYQEGVDIFVDKEWPVSFGLELYKNSTSSMKYEIEMRINSLKTINDNKYKNIKEACLKQLEKDLDKITSFKNDFKGEEFIYQPPELFAIVVQNFNQLPNSDNALKIYEIAKNEAIREQDLPFLFIVPHPSSGYKGLPSDRYLLLEKEAYSGNAGAIRTLLRFYSISSGLMNEVIRGSLSNLASINPRFFVGALTTEKVISEDTLDKLICYVDYTRTFPDETKKEIILLQRINGLSAIKDKINSKVINRCLKVIEKHVNNKKAEEDIIPIVGQ